MRTHGNLRLGLAGFGCAAALAIAAPAAAQVPDTIPVQGVLSDGSGTPIHGTTTVEFRIYSAATGGTELWSETQTVVADNGAFTVYLGAVAALDLAIFDGSPRWLGLQIGSDAEMSPRLGFATVPYAAMAARADHAATADSAATLGSLAPGDVAPVSHTHSAADITSGTLDHSRYDAYANLGSRGRIDNNSGTDLLTRSQSDDRYLRRSTVEFFNLEVEFPSAPVNVQNVGQHQFCALTTMSGNTGSCVANGTSAGAWTLSASLAGASGSGTCRFVCVN